MCAAHRRPHLNPVYKSFELTRQKRSNLMTCPMFAAGHPNILIKGSFSGLLVETRPGQYYQKVLLSPNRSKDASISGNIVLCYHFCWRYPGYLETKGWRQYGCKPYPQRAEMEKDGQLLAFLRPLLRGLASIALPPPPLETTCRKLWQARQARLARSPRQGKALHYAGQFYPTILAPLELCNRAFSLT
ncbi:uncharacterized protein PAC_08835 [Phialocephala subalpina]|uniref:Uncharacterized protein n=1 Tax=Phialocephala subalpina TaxID=576137 RepID=A0A1L7X1P0_9HELO|nr:uncharacterized protein PAC_08835 [Phialocephala subalpina]